MNNKKGSNIGYPIYLPWAIFTLVLILLVFSIVFFVFGLAKSNNLSIDATSSASSLQLLNILKTNVEYQSKNITIAEYFSIASSDDSEKETLTLYISGLLKKMPVPKNKQSYWDISAKKGDSDFLDVGESVVAGSDYLSQKVNIPVKDGSIIYINLFLNCLGCDQESLGEVS